LLGTVLPELPDPEANVINQQEILDVHADLIQGVREMREKNAAKMKARWDTKNTQVVKEGDYVLVDARIKKKWRAKAILGERIYSMPGIVSEVNANGNILVHYKNGLETPINKPVPNNQFKVIDENMYNSVDMSPIEEDDSDPDGAEVLFFLFSLFLSFPLTSPSPFILLSHSFRLAMTWI
jgi:hypothetical protein